MSNTARLAAVVSAAAVAATSLVVAAPASASPGSYLVLTVRESGGQPRHARLRCAPPSGTHPHAAEACAAIGTAGGDLTRLAPRDGVMCTMVYRPASATGRGLWSGRAVRYRHTYPNLCELQVATGAVFDF